MSVVLVFSRDTGSCATETPATRLVRKVAMIRSDQRPRVEALLEQMVDFLLTKQAATIDGQVGFAAESLSRAGSRVAATSSPGTPAPPAS